MDLLGREVLAVGFDAIVCGKMDMPAAPGQGEGERFGREQMTAGTARRQENNSRHRLRLTRCPN
jgi:hypothetical protein